jgi:hypothetical protein
MDGSEMMPQQMQESNSNTTIRGSKKMSEDSANSEMEARMKKMQQERDADMKMISGNRPPMSF